MDPLDFAPLAPPQGRRRGGDRTENVVAGLVTFGLPLVYLAVLTVTDLTKRPGLAVLYLPAFIAAAGALVCIGGRVGLRRSVVTVAGCLWWCVVAAVTMVAVDILIFPF